MVPFTPRGSGENDKDPKEIISKLPLFSFVSAYIDIVASIMMGGQLLESQICTEHRQEESEGLKRTV